MRCLLEGNDRGLKSALPIKPFVIELIAP